MRRMAAERKYICNRITRPWGNVPGKKGLRFGAGGADVTLARQRQRGCRHAILTDCI